MEGALPLQYPAWLAWFPAQVSLQIGKRSFGWTLSAGTSQGGIASHLNRQNNPSAPINSANGKVPHFCSCGGIPHPKKGLLGQSTQHLTTHSTSPQDFHASEDQRGEGTDPALLPWQSHTPQQRRR